MLPFVLALWCIVEVQRLWFGYMGNLQEKVGASARGCRRRRCPPLSAQIPQLLFFLLLSVLPQVPFVLYLTWLQRGATPFERAAGIPLAFFLVRTACAAAALLALR